MSVYRTIGPLVCVSSQVMVFVHARNETVRTASILRDNAKNNGDIKIFLPDQTVQYGEAQKSVRSVFSSFQNCICGYKSL